VYYFPYYNLCGYFSTFLRPAVLKTGVQGAPKFATRDAPSCTGSEMPVNKEKTVRTSVIVPTRIYKQVQELAVRSDVSAAWVIRHALQAFLDAHGNAAAEPMTGRTGRTTQARLKRR
jgi:hypothetical protein